ncbi:hypothetical protein [Paenibacillus xanthanilyticus]|uniref:Uncharacterized protein n=1 Tax=Paenibacillus xanthanilyticus TaxID=1783531 RepID=A0ABV8K787_9BACL
MARKGKDFAGEQQAFEMKSSHAENNVTSAENNNRRQKGSEPNTPSTG